MSVSTDPTSDTLRIEHRLEGRFRIERTLAHSATARLLEAVELASGRHVALKLLEEHFSSHALVRARFQREMEAVAALRHRNVHRVLELGVDQQGRPFAVLEPLSGVDLEGLCRERGGRLEPAELRPIARAAAEGLLAAHREGIVHRDVQPRHLVLGADGQWKVGEFGMASVDGAVGLTSHSIVLGAPLYLAPEIIGSSAVDPRADVYSLGVTLYGCLAGRPAWSTSNSGDLLRRKLTEEPPALPERIAAADPALAVIVRRAMARRPSDRYCSMEELLRVLGAADPAALALRDPARRLLCPSCGAEREEGVALCLECGAEDTETTAMEDAVVLVLEELSGDERDLQAIARELASVTDEDAERLRQRLERVRSQLPQLMTGPLRLPAAQALQRRLASLRCRTALYPEGLAFDGLMTGSRGLLLTTMFIFCLCVLPLAITWATTALLSFEVASVLGALTVPAVLLGFATQQRRIYRLLGRRLRPLLRSVRRSAAPALGPSVVEAYQSALAQAQSPELRECSRSALRLGSRLLGLLDVGTGLTPELRSELRRDVKTTLAQAFTLASRIQVLDEVSGFDARQCFDRLTQVERALEGHVPELEGARLRDEKQALERAFERSAKDERLRAAAVGRLLELLGRLEELSARLAQQHVARAEEVRELGRTLKGFAVAVESRCAAVGELAPMTGTLLLNPILPEGDHRQRVYLPASSLPPANELNTGPVADTAPSGQRYRLIREIGRGGIAVVYQAEDRHLGRAVAIKTVTAAGHSVAVYRERLQRELDAAQQLDDPRIVRVYELLEEGDRLSLVMEFVPGPDLKRLLEHRGGRLSAEEVTHVGREALESLAAAHRQGIVHGDVKPHNLLCAPDGHIKLADFGMARLESELGVATGALVFGTPEYAAPEILGGEALDHRADIYGLGITLYELATGRLPYGGRSPFELLHAQAQDQARRPRELVAGIPEFLEQAICTAMEKDPEERFQSAEEMLAALQPRDAVSAERAKLPAASPTALELCLLCQAENAAGSPICWSCGAPPAAVPAGDAMIAVTSGGEVGAEETWQQLARFSGSHGLTEAARWRWALAAYRAPTITPGTEFLLEPERDALEMASRLRSRGYRVALQWFFDLRGRLTGPAGLEKYGRGALAVSAATAIGRFFPQPGPLPGWGVVLLALASAGAVYRLVPAALARLPGWLVAQLAPSASAGRRSILEPTSRRLNFRNILVKPPKGGWTVGSWARLHRDIAEVAPGKPFRSLAYPSPEIVLKDIDTNIAGSLSLALRQRGVAAEVRSVRGRNEDLVTNSVLLVPAGVLTASVFAGLGVFMNAFFYKWLGMSSEPVLVFIAIASALYMAYFSRRLLLRGAGRVAGYLRRPLLEPVAAKQQARALPQELGQRYRLLLERTRGTRLHRQLQRLFRRALRLQGQAETMERTWFGETSVSSPLLRLVERGLEVVERAHELDVFLARHPEMELLGRTLELEQALGGELPAEQRQAMERRLEQARQTLNRYADVDRERRRLGSLLSRVSSVLVSAERRVQQLQAIEEPDEARLLQQSLAELERELEGWSARPELGP